MTWNDSFLALFDHCCNLYRSGNSDFMSHYTPSDLAFLQSFGYQPREFFDFVEDFVDASTPSPSTALLIAAARRDYFIHIQNRQPSSPKLNRHNIPSFGDTLLNIPYLPRIIAKANAKLRGELDPDLMFGCGGDRNFLKNHGDIHPADFLRFVWSAHLDDEKIARWVASHSS